MPPIIDCMTFKAAPHTARPSTRVGFSPDELVLHTWGTDRTPRYAARVPGLNVLVGETLALVGDGTHALLEALAEELDDCVRLDGAAAAAAGTVRIHAVQAARVGIRGLVVTDPFAGTGASSHDLALADLAGVADLGLTTVVAVTDVGVAALFADRVVVVRDGRPQVAYPVLAPTPRSPAEVVPVTDRVTARLAGAALG